MCLVIGGGSLNVPIDEDLVKIEDIKSYCQIARQGSGKVAHSHTLHQKLCFSSFLIRPIVRPAGLHKLSPARCC